MGLVALRIRPEMKTALLQNMEEHLFQAASLAHSVHMVGLVGEAVVGVGEAVQSEVLFPAVVDRPAVRTQRLAVGRETQEARPLRPPPRVLLGGLATGWR